MRQCQQLSPEEMDGKGGQWKCASVPAHCVSEDWEDKRTFSTLKQCSAVLVYVDGSGQKRQMEKLESMKVFLPGSNLVFSHSGRLEDDRRVIASQ